jgi:cytochrome c-type biogenesis protein CcmF
LVLLALVIGGSLVLYALRAPKVASGGSFDLVSRETLLLVNNVLLAAAAGTVLLGTLYPLAVDAFGLGKISVGPPYFNTVFVPLMVPLLFFVALGPLASWRSASAGDLARRMKVAFFVSILGGSAIPFAMGEFVPLVALSMSLVFWISPRVGADARAWRTGPGARDARRARAAAPLLACRAPGSPCSGSAWRSRAATDGEVRVAPGEILTLGGYGFRLIGVKAAANYTSVIGEVELLRDGKVVKILRPEKRKYLSSEMPMTEAAIDPGLTRDIYVSIGEPLGHGAWSVRAQVKPFIDWIWSGCLLMALGGLLALLDRRYRVRARAAVEGEALAAGRA